MSKQQITKVTRVLSPLSASEIKEHLKDLELSLTPKGREIYDSLSELVQNTNVQQAILNTEAFDKIHKSLMENLNPAQTMETSSSMETTLSSGGQNSLSSSGNQRLLHMTHQTPFGNIKSPSSSSMEIPSTDNSKVLPRTSATDSMRNSSFSPYQTPSPFTSSSPISIVPPNPRNVFSNSPSNLSPMLPSSLLDQISESPSSTGNNSFSGSPGLYVKSGKMWLDWSPKSIWDWATELFRKLLSTFEYIGSSEADLSQEDTSLVSETLIGTQGTVGNPGNSAQITPESSNFSSGKIAMGVSIIGVSIMIALVTIKKNPANFGVTMNQSKEFGRLVLSAFFDYVLNVKYR